MHQVEIRIEGRLDNSWTEWLEGFAFSYTEQDETILTGEVEDQAALYGLIAKLRDLGVKLISVNSVQQETGNAPLDVSFANRDEPEDIPDENTDGF
ncbi:MAG TPA: hypothetical protein VLA72_22140 [Anaerolineales bacterium]|nr:hypothetical protein [Anaerolineales bacterium]